MPKLREILTCIALASLSAFLIALTAATCTIATIAQQIPKQLDAAIIETRAQVLGQIADAEHDLFKRVDQIAAKADGQLTATRADAVGEIRATRELVISQLGVTLARVDSALGEIHELRTSVGPVIENAAQLTAHAGSVAKQVDDAAPLFLDCDHNVDCLMNRYVGVSKGVEKAALNVGAMSTEVRTALPAALLTWQSIGGNVDRTSANVARITKPHWYDTALKSIGAGAGVGIMVLRH